MKKIIYLLLLFTQTVVAQNKDLHFSGYVETYYSYNFSKPSNHTNYDFMYNFNRHNELNLNLAFAKVNYTTEKIRGNAALMVGNYAQYNMSAEPNWAQFVYEANIGFKISKKNNMWLDAGILPSHIGFESAVGADCWTLTRSILAENSPYYETGVRASYTSKNEKLYASILALNGWQNISRNTYFQNPNAGAQITYKPISNLTLNYSNFLGSVKPDSQKAIRLFHNFYVIYEPKSKFSFTFGFDLGHDKFDSYHYGYWYSPVFISRYKINAKNKIALRVEKYIDSKQIFITSNTLHGFNVLGVSVNYDKQIKENFLWRIETKHYFSKDKFFENFNHHDNNILTTSLSLKI